jgi:phosphatidylserine decarboxylase
MNGMQHQYVDRATGVVVEERLLADRWIQALYSPLLENAAWLSRVASSRYTSRLLGYLNYDNLLSSRITGMHRFLHANRVNTDELLALPEELDTPRKIFERKIKYWKCRPLPPAERCVVCPADARLMVGSMNAQSGLFIKNKFFEFAELLGPSKRGWHSAFSGGDFSVLRLTPEKYHYTHAPVTGRVRDFYSVGGRYHSCNPNATVQLLHSHSKNRRVVTIFDTDCEGGTGVGSVAMIEVVALMVGRISQLYSEHAYDNPRPVEKGMMLRIGAPKALFRPGSSTVALLFQSGRIRFAEDLVRNQSRASVCSRYSAVLGSPLCETDVKVRSLLAHATGGPARD